MPKPRKNKNTQTGVANAVTIARIGADHLNDCLRRLNGPYYVSWWNHNRTDITSLWSDGTLRDAVVEFQGKITSTLTNTTRKIIVPLVVREGHLLDPVAFSADGRVYVWSAEAFKEALRGDVYERPIPDRSYLYDYPVSNVPPIKNPQPAIGLGIYSGRRDSNNG